MINQKEIYKIHSLFYLSAALGKNTQDGSTTMVSFINLKCTVFSSTLIESCFAGPNVNIRDLQDISEKQAFGLEKLPE